MRESLTGSRIASVGIYKTRGEGTEGVAEIVNLKGKDAVVMHDTLHKLVYSPI